MRIFEIYVEKKPEFAVEASSVLADLRTALKCESVTSLRIINRYLAQNLTEEDFKTAAGTVFSEPQVDEAYSSVQEFLDKENTRAFAVEFLPGQFDQRADSAAQCISLSTGKERPEVRSAKIYLLDGDITDDELSKIKAYIINPVESRETGFEIPDTLLARFDEPENVRVLNGFIDLDDAGIGEFLTDYSLAMDFDDLKLCRDYFKSEDRDPTITEIRMLDTYWSDHCRHTTFLTRLDSAEIEPASVKRAWDNYLALRKKLYAGKDKPVTLMDIATIGAKALKADGYLKELDESEEINACSVKITVDVDGRDEDWLLMFKNETHNHPTEIEPFGGAATCLGGAIRDPLSGRSYVYQAMRVTGAADPTASMTMAGKLPQRKLVQTAAAGYSSYGNQIGLATGHVHEIYHDGYAAKRMELGAVLGAAPARNVVRDVPSAGDIVILLGGRTGRDGCGGATGSSKSHTASSLETCGAEVQKGNAPEERKIQRLFRDRRATRLIKRCNDFGAGGVSVSIGELADGLDINLDAVPKKYDGLDGTELAISESQERMSVVVSPENAEKFIRLAENENLEATIVAEVTEAPRLVMRWRGEKIVDISREFLNSNGAEKHAGVKIPETDLSGVLNKSSSQASRRSIIDTMSDLRFCSQKGLVERFDSTVGAGTVLMPFGGKYQMTQTQAMAAKIPVLDGETTTCSIMAWGYSPEITCASPYHGGEAAVVESVAKLIAAGGSRKRCWLSLQEYFARLGSDPERWGAPAAALLGALNAQLGLKVGAIGGKDSMSGSFEQLDVPPTIVSFAVGAAKTDAVISPEFKSPESHVYYIREAFVLSGDENKYDSLTKTFDEVESLIASGKIRAAWAIGEGGSTAAISNMCFGNRIGFKACGELDTKPMTGGFIVEAEDLGREYESSKLGVTTQEYVLELVNGEKIDINELETAWQERLEPVYPCNKQPESLKPAATAAEHSIDAPAHAKAGTAKPRVLIPVFPGTNCEYDTARAFQKAGADAEIFVVKNLTPGAIEESVNAFVKSVAASQIIALPGGFSGGDEPDGSAKFITAFLRNPRISEEIMRLLNSRDGLMCGICNGFQALIKLGLVPYGEIRKPEHDSPTLTFNSIGRHQSKLVRTKIVSNKSPWLQNLKTGSIFTAPVSHGEGRFIIRPELFEELSQNGQIATIYVDLDGNPTQDVRYNPNNSYAAVEGILSPDGRVFGKMAHSERCGDSLYKNIPYEKNEMFMDMFSGAVDYFG